MARGWCLATGRVIRGSYPVYLGFIGCGYRQVGPTEVSGRVALLNGGSRSRICVLYRLERAI